GEPWIELGAHTLLGADITLSAGFVPGLDLGPRPMAQPSPMRSSGRGSHVVAHASIEVGDFVYTGPHVYITDQNHS
ncbi:sugar acetyltransferase, partial [Marinitenerispora sediminis]